MHTTRLDRELAELIRHYAPRVLFGERMLAQQRARAASVLDHHMRWWPPRQLGELLHSVSNGPGELVFRVAKRIAARRRECGLTQEAMAERLGMQDKNVQRIEAGEQNLTLETVEWICFVLGVSTDSILATDPAVDIDEPPKLPTPLARLFSAGFRVRSGVKTGRHPRKAVRVMTLRAAAGTLTGVAKRIEILGWVHLPRPSPPPEGQFVAEIVGSSMEPKVRSGGLCLFGPPGPPPYEGRTVLVSHDSLQDDDLGGPYALKRIQSIHTLPDGRTRIVLTSLNSEYPPIVIDAHEGEFRIVAELVKVIVAGPSETS